MLTSTWKKTKRELRVKNATSLQSLFLRVNREQLGLYLWCALFVRQSATVKDLTVKLRSWLPGKLAKQLNLVIHENAGSFLFQLFRLFSHSILCVHKGAEVIFVMKFHVHAWQNYLFAVGKDTALFIPLGAVSGLSPFRKSWMKDSFPPLHSFISSSNSNPRR